MGISVTEQGGSNVCGRGSGRLGNRGDRVVVEIKPFHSLDLLGKKEGFLNCLFIQDGMLLA